MEALIGAIYLDKGFNFVHRYIIHHILRLHIDVDELVITEFNFKSKLYEWAQRNRKHLSFEVKAETGRSHKKQYTIAVMVDSVEISESTNFSKRKPSNRPPERACAKLELVQSINQHKKKSPGYQW